MNAMKYKNGSWGVTACTLSHVNARERESRVMADRGTAGEWYLDRERRQQRGSQRGVSVGRHPESRKAWRALIRA